MKKIRIPAELLFLAGNLLLSLAVSTLSAVNFGLSQIVAPAYILHQKLGVITFGQGEYILQAVLFVVFCLIMKRVRLLYLGSFVTCLFYGLVLDGWRAAVPFFNPAVTPPGSMDWPVRVVLFVFGVLLTTFSVALLFHTYLYPQVYDFFVKGLSRRFKQPLGRMKSVFDLCMLTLATAMTLLFFGKFVGVSFGTLIMAAVNGPLIGWWNKWMVAHIESVPLFPRLAARFERELD
ncbi:MAG: hypothetical protein J6R77_06690 [Clostridia bacterium]|nr:hypothetical protein [Clostridia bacterium]